MADELVDVVNERDEVIGQEMKWICHDKELWHRISGVFIFNSEGKILLQTRNKNKTSGGLLDYSASGHVISGETYENGAYKEMGEELGIKIKLKDSGIKIFENHSYNKKTNIKHIIRIFIGYHEGSFNIQKEELDSVAFYDLENIKKMILRNPEKFTMGFKLGFKTYVEKK